MPDDLHNRYRILRKLGEGGMGEVHLALDTKLDRQVAVKLLSAEQAGDPDRRRRFLLEARAASALNHPNVCVIHEVGETADNSLFIVMEFVEGESLADRSRRAGYSVSEAVAVSLQIADALDAAHSKGIVHRDIKPGNVTITSRGQVKVLDFGLAKKLDAVEGGDAGDLTALMTRQGQVLGTPSYMSPEQALGREVDARTDLFSLGVVLYEMLTGQSPFAGSSLGDTLDRILRRQPEPLARFCRAATPELERIVRKCLGKEADRRYQSARELAVDLKNLERELARESLKSLDATALADASDLARSYAEAPAPARTAPGEARNPEVLAADELSKSDVLIACAPVDDEPWSRDEPGWITQLRRNLEVRLAQLSGEQIRVGSIPRALAESISAGDLSDGLRRTKALVTVLSPPFARSDGCRQLVEAFWQAAERSSGMWVHNHPRVLKVVKAPVAAREMPPGLAALLSQILSFDFYDQDPATGSVVEFDARFGPDARQRYFERVYDLAQEIYRLIIALRAATSEKPVRQTEAEAVLTGAEHDRKTIYLAAATTDVQLDVDRIRRELIAHGHAVLPDRPLPLVASELESRVTEALGRCDFSVHPIGDIYGLIPEGADASLAVLQNRLAAARSKAAGLRRVIWLRRGAAAPADPRQREFVDALMTQPEFHHGAELIQDHVEALKELILKRLKPKSQSPAGEVGLADRDGPPRVYLICSREDERSALELEDYLFEQGFEVSLPDFEAGEAEAAEAHRLNLAECDAALIYYGAARHGWVDIKLRGLLKASGYGRAEPILVKAVYVAPPVDERKQRFRTHLARVIRQSSVFKPTSELAEFVAAAKGDRP